MLKNRLKFCLKYTIYPLYQQSRHFAAITSNELPRGSAENSNLSIGAHLPNFTPAESSKILETLNNTNAVELLSFNISKARANKLYAWRSKNGPLQSLEDILNVEGFGNKEAIKLCQSIIQPDINVLTKSKTKKRARTATFIIPTLDENQRKSITSCVGVRIGMSNITWSRLLLVKEMPCQLTHWQNIEVSDKKLHISELMERCLYIIQDIPDADCYLLENPQIIQASSNPGSIDQQNVNIQKAQITAVISYALSTRGITEAAKSDSTQKSFTKKNVYFLRRLLSSRLFNNLVGTERVSSVDTVLQLMRTNYNFNDREDSIPEIADDDKPNPFVAKVHFPNDLRSMFAEAERYKREFLSQALLLNLTFVRLVLQQDAMSIAIVTNNTKNMKN